MTNNLTLAKEIWHELSTFIDDGVDRSEAADALLAILIDNDIEPTEIRESFKNDEWMMDSVANHLKDGEMPDPDDWSDSEEEDEDYYDEIDEDY